MHMRTIALSICALVAASGCKDRIDDEERLIARGDQFGDIHFSGYALDGVTGRAIAGYELQLIFGTTTKKARVDRDTNRFTVGGLPEAQDYAVRITADGYRPFESSNGQFQFQTETEAFAGGRRDFVYVAYLYPTSIVAPDTTINVFLDDNTTPAGNGTVRLTPTQQASDVETDFTPVGAQVWRNTLDQLTGTQSAALTNGVATFSGANLVYGVTYDINVFGVPGYQPDSGDDITIGDLVIDDISLESNASPAIVVQYISSDIYRGQVPASTPVSLTFVFNRPVELLPNTAGVAANAVDLDSDFTVPDTNNNGNTLTYCTSMSDTDAECGWSVTVSGNTLTITGTRSLDITTDDTGDRVSSVTFGGFYSINLRPAGSTVTGFESSLGDLDYDGADIGSDITVPVTQF
jgi:hypothetical protein